MSASRSLVVLLAVQGCSGLGDTGLPLSELPMVVAGWMHSCGLLPDGEAECWGSDTHGQVSASPGKPLTAISAGGGFACGLDVGGLAVCWPELDGFHLNDYPTFTQLSTGMGMACGILSSGELHCFGLYDEESKNYTETETYFPPEGTFQQLSVNHIHGCAVDTTNQLACWGGIWDQEPPPGEYLSVSTGSSFNCAISVEHEIICWGPYYDEEHHPPDGKFAIVEVGSGFACAVDLDNELTCWGDMDFEYPLGFIQPTGKIARLSVGPIHGCATTFNGESSCWGGCTYGQCEVPDRFGGL